MDTFENCIDKNKFRSTNAIWNELKLNHPMSVGYVTTLIESKSFETKEEWRDYYFESGQERLKLANAQGIDLSSNTSKAKHLNGNFGRTLEELQQKGRQMYQAILQKGNPLNITLAECIYMVKYRVIGETYNGVVMRERNTLQTLQSHFPQCSFHKVSGEDDFRYAIDYEMHLHNNLISAIQIKPLSYQKGFASQIQIAKKANQIKNREYNRQYGVPVIYVYSTNKGEILNPESILSLQSTIPLLSKAI